MIFKTNKSCKTLSFNKTCVVSATRPFSSKRSNKNIGDVGHQNLFYNISFSSTKVECTLQNFIVYINTKGSFGAFILALNTLFKLNTSRSGIVLSAAKILFLFCVLPVLLSTDFVLYLSGISRNIRIPQFCYSFLTKISVLTVTNDKSGGMTSGSIVTTSENNLSFIFNYLLSLEDSDLAKIYTNTLLESVVNSRFELHSLHKSFRNILLPYFVISNSNSSSPVYTLRSKLECYELLLEFLSQFSTVSLTNSVPYFEGLFTLSTSRKIGIYRFRNSGYDDVFLAQQASIVTKLEPFTINYFCTFLVIFKPTFCYVGELNKWDVKLPIPGDLTLSVESLELQTAWELFVSPVFGPSAEEVSEIPSTGKNQGTDPGSGEEYRRKRKPKSPFKGAEGSSVPADKSPAGGSPGAVDKRTFSTYTSKSVLGFSTINNNSKFTHGLSFRSSIEHYNIQCVCLFSYNSPSR